jgi:hypothetical protein
LPRKEKSMLFQSIKTNTGTVRYLPGSLPPAAAPSSATEPLLPVLIVLHRETSTPGRVGNALRALGHPLDIRRPRFGDALPETLDGHAGAVIFGGPMSANDPDDFVRREIDWIEVPLREQRPFMGPRLRGSSCAGIGLNMSIIGTAKGSTFPAARNCWRRDATSRCRHFVWAIHSASSFIPT